MSTGVHQKYSDKSHRVKDIMGYLREDHLLDGGPTGYSKNDYEFLESSQDDGVDAGGLRLISPKVEGIESSWYTVKGKKRIDQPGDLRLMLKFTAIGLCFYTAAFTNFGTLPAYIS